MGIEVHTYCFEDFHNKIEEYSGTLKHIDLLYNQQILSNNQVHNYDLLFLRNNFMSNYTFGRKSVLEDQQKVQLSIEVHMFYFHHLSLDHINLESLGIYQHSNL